MEVSRIISDSAHYSLQFSTDIGKLLVLAVVAIIPLVNFLALGYLARVMRATPESGHLPPLDRWGELFLDGLVLVVISLCYLAAGIIVTTALLYIFSFPLALLGWAVIFLGFILLPMALVHSVKTGNPSKGFAVREIVAKVSKFGWLDYIIWVVAMFVLPSVLMFVLILVPIIGWFIALLVSPAIGVFMARAAALVYSA